MHAHPRDNALLHVSVLVLQLHMLLPRDRWMARTQQCIMAQETGQNFIVCQEKNFIVCQENNLIVCQEEHMLCQHCGCLFAVLPCIGQSSSTLSLWILQAHRHVTGIFRYTEYLASKFKSKNKAEFERQKNGDAFKRRFDPFMFKEEVEARAHVAQTAALTVRLCHTRQIYISQPVQLLRMPAVCTRCTSMHTPPSRVHCTTSALNAELLRITFEAPLATAHQHGMFDVCVPSLSVSACASRTCMLHAASEHASPTHFETDKQDVGPRSCQTRARVCGLLHRCCACVQ